MNARRLIRFLPFAGALTASFALAQPSRMAPPAALPAIQTHLEQQRTREHLEAMEKEKAPRPAAAKADKPAKRAARNPRPAEPTAKP